MRSRTADPYAWLGEYTRRLDERRRAEIVETTLGAVLVEVPELADPDLRGDLTDLAGECLRSILFAATLPRDTWVDPALPIAGMDFCRTLVRRGDEVVVLFKVFRTGHSHFWRSIMDVADVEIDDPVLRMGVLDVMWERLSRWLDFLMDRLARVYQDERERWLRGALARRAEIVRAILDAEDVATESAGAVLGHDLARWQTAFALRAAPREAAGPVLDLLEAAASELAAALGAGRAFTLPSGANGLWAWVATPSPPDRAALVPAALGDAPVRVGAGRAARGIEGFRRSHREAVAAQRAAAAARAPRQLTRYEDVELVSLLSADRDAMRTFVAAELGPLAARGAGPERLRATALTFLESAGNGTAAARRLGVHRNTVRNRVGRAEELLGRRLDTGSVAVRLALLLATEVDLDRLAPSA